MRLNSQQADARQRLLEQIRAIEQQGGSDAASHRSGIIRTGWEAVDRILDGGGLPCGAIHEWFPGGGRRHGTRDPGHGTTEPGTRDSGHGTRDNYPPPLCILTHLAHQTLAATPTGSIVWVGRLCRPNPRALCRDRGRDQTLLERSLFVDFDDVPHRHERSARLWAIDLALRCGAVAAVVADGRGLDMPATRRLQLAAESSGAVALIARPEREIAELSAAATRWRVQPAACEHEINTPQWTLELLRQKGGQVIGGERVFTVQWNAPAGAVALSADVVDRSPAATSPRRDATKKRTA